MSDLPTPKELSCSIAGFYEGLSVTFMLLSLADWRFLACVALLIGFAQLHRWQGRKWKRNHLAKQRPAQ